jgi:hypothetical protein
MARRLAWQFAAGGLHERMDKDARQGTYPRRHGRIPYGAQADADGPPSPGQALTRAGPHQDKQPEALHQDGPRGCRRGQARLGELTAEYGAQLMEGLSVLSPEQSEGMGTRGKHVNARRVQHLMGFLKNHLSSEDKAYRGWVHLR